MGHFLLCGAFWGIISPLPGPAGGTGTLRVWGHIAPPVTPGPGQGWSSSCSPLGSAAPLGSPQRQGRGWQGAKVPKIAAVRQTDHGHFSPRIKELCLVKKITGYKHMAQNSPSLAPLSLASAQQKTDEKHNQDNSTFTPKSLKLKAYQ